MKKKYLVWFTSVMMIMVSCMNNEQEGSNEEIKEVIPNEYTEEMTAAVPDELLGSWKLEMPGDGEGVPHQLFRRIFHKSGSGMGSYEIYWIAALPDFGPTVMAAEKGDLSLNADTLFLSPTAFGSEQMGPMSDGFYDTTRWYYPGDSLFDMFRNDPYGLFYVEGDTLFWKKDLNNDGKFIDQNEVTRFYREPK